MCQHCQHIAYEDVTDKKKYRLKDFFDMWWDDYCKNPTEYIRPEQYKAVNAMRVCQTEALGVDYYACPDCGEISEIRHSCKNRFCPTCSWKDTIKWAEKIKSQMLDIPHRHVVFTLPHSLNGLIEHNKVDLLNVMTRVSADILKSWFKVKYNVKIGIIGVIHTFGERKNAHYHIHMIVSWGGIDYKTGDLVEFKGKEKEYVNYNHLKKEFRRKYIDELEKLFDDKKLNHNFKDKAKFKDFIIKLHKNKWHINLEEPMDTPATVIRYIGRYSKRACLSEYKIIDIEGEYITFEYKDYTDRTDPKDKKSPAKVKEMQLHYRKFFPLLLQHVPPPYFRMVRYYGVYARFNNIPDEYKATDEEKLSEIIEQEYETSSNNPKYCSSCTRSKIYVYTLLDLRKKYDRNEPFDIEKHKHDIYKKVPILPEEANVKKVAKK